MGYQGKSKRPRYMVTDGEGRPLGFVRRTRHGLRIHYSSGEAPTFEDMRALRAEVARRGQLLTRIEGT